MFRKIITPMFFLLFSHAYAESFQAIAGDYFNGSQSQPYVLSKVDHFRWEFANNMTNMPQEIASLEADAISCAGSSCSIVGQWQDKHNKQFPLLITTNNDGQAFKYILPNAIHHFPKQFSYAMLSDISCSDSVCVAVGEMGKTNKQATILLLESHDLGVNWDMMTTGMTASKQRLLERVFCEGKVCIAATSKHIIRSEDNGYSWNYVTNIADLPNNFGYSHVRSIQCSNQTCVMAGEFDYKHTNANDTEVKDYLYLLVSHDLGKSWRMITSVDNNPISNRQGAFYSAQCTANGSVCLVAGRYADESPTSLVFWRSSDEGKTWSSIQNIDDTQAIQKSGLFALHCSDKVCLAGGSDSNQNPLLLVSHDKGFSWNVIKQIQDMPTFTRLMQVHCNNENCYAVGQFKRQESSNWLPLLVESDSAGLNWKLENQVEHSPTTMAAGIITAA